MKKFFIFFTIVLISFVAGFFAATYFNNFDEVQICKPFYDQAWNEARERLDKFGFRNDLAGDRKVDTTSVSGTIESLGEGFVNVKIIPMEILADKDLDTRKIKVTSNTKITVYKTKPKEQYDEELKDFYDNYQGEIGPDAPAGLPLNFVKESGVFSILKQGQKVEVKSNENIFDKKEFFATEIVAID